ncbi:MAG: TerB family tellurite resistance protein, partial [Acidibacter sp.]|nr:TerB family tellurite resistance protein [Acidibacter sp.]
MLKHWRELFGTVQSAVGGTAEQDNHRLQLATAVLLIEIMQSDSGASEIEVTTVERLLRERFDLTADELAALMSLARTRQETAHDLHAFTSQLHAALDESELFVNPAAPPLRGPGLEALARQYVEVQGIIS